MSKLCATAKDFEYDRREIRLITPAVARSMINSSDEADKIAGSSVRRYADEIRIGLWSKPKHTVSLLGDKVKSGHEFLYGIMEANVPARLYFDVVPETLNRKRRSFMPGDSCNTESKDDGRSVVAKSSINGDRHRFSPEITNLFSSNDDENSDLRMKVESITPERAAGYLECNTRNRKIRQHKVTMYANEMLAGNWKLNHQGIAFYADDTLADGQHRLLAIIQAGMTVKMLVTRGLDRSSGTTMDIGGIRNDVDLASALGVGANFNHKESAVGKAMQTSVRNGKASRQDSLRFTIRHLEAIRFAMSAAKSWPANNSLVRATIARAYYTVDHDILVKFGAVLTHGHVEGPHESAAITLRNYITRDKACLTSNYHRASTILKTHAALSAFIEGRSLARLQEVGKLIFLLPGETV